ncbi:hypothetical protein [Rubrivivax sp. JA1055]|uniref:hypothetical protein n=1 Tax=Rubrivivax sp. JA1055 TaxID=2894194 RepID=UPI001E4261B6|nr:hypothetical protein [Rubrivivax sp. JA1055]MCC9598436.1 hypothetical protein [Rubrivivax sp. JA1055]
MSLSSSGLNKKMQLRRYKCPHCGSALERTVVHPAWLSLEAKGPEFQMPLLPVIGAIVVLGLGFALIHPALSLLVIYVFVHWLYWRYYSFLHCSSCGRFYFGGQISGKPHETLPWTGAAIRRLAIKVGIAGGIIGVIFAPLYILEIRSMGNCKKECALGGGEAALRGFRGDCIQVPGPR